MKTWTVFSGKQQFRSNYLCETLVWPKLNFPLLLLLLSASANLNGKSAISVSSSLVIHLNIRCNLWVLRYSHTFLFCEFAQIYAGSWLTDFADVSMALFSVRTTPEYHGRRKCVKNLIVMKLMNDSAKPVLVFAALCQLSGTLVARQAQKPKIVFHKNFLNWIRAFECSRLFWCSWTHPV